MCVQTNTHTFDKQPFKWCTTGTAMFDIAMLESLEKYFKWNGIWLVVYDIRICMLFQWEKLKIRSFKVCFKRKSDENWWRGLEDEWNRSEVGWDKVWVILIRNKNRFAWRIEEVLPSLFATKDQHLNGVS